jgi:hypothetical protein
MPGYLSFDGEAVAMAHTAGLDADAHLAPCRLWHVPLDEFKRASGTCYLHRPHLCHRYLLLLKGKVHGTATAAWV